jgi:hypothetical protein
MCGLWPEITVFDNRQKSVAVLSNRKDLTRVQIFISSEKVTQREKFSKTPSLAPSLQHDGTCVCGSFKGTKRVLESE